MREEREKKRKRILTSPARLPLMRALVEERSPKYPVRFNANETSAAPSEANKQFVIFLSRCPPALTSMLLNSPMKAKK